VTEMQSQAKLLLLLINIRGTMLREKTQNFLVT